MKLKSLLFVLVGIVLLIVAGVGFYLLGQKMSEKTSYKDITPTPTPISLEVTPEPVSGTIVGPVSYPSEGIPAEMQVCAETLQFQKVVCVPTENASYKLTVPPGTYFVYAHLPSQPSKAYYSEFVTCGLNASCPSHKPIEVPVMAGESVEDIHPGDWYNTNN